MLVQNTCLQMGIDNGGDIQVGLIYGGFLHNSFRSHLMEDCNDLS